MKNNGNVFYEAIVLSLALLFILLMAVAFEKDREHHLEVYAKDQQIFELQRKLDETGDLYGKATYHIEMSIRSVKGNEFRRIILRFLDRSGNRC